MTAFARYDKLEAVARYLDGASPAAREVVLSFGERSLIIMGLDDRPIAHWPLASLRALGPPASRPLELVPDPASDERLLLDDAEMSAAIEAVCPRLHAAEARQRRRGRRPWRVLWLVAAGAAALAVVGLSELRPALPERLSRMVPPEREAALGEAVAARLPGMLGGGGIPLPELCTAAEGTVSLRALTARLAAPGQAGEPGAPLRVAVLDHPGIDALALPGGRVMLLRGLIEAARTPEEVAAVLAHAAGHMRDRAPLRDALAEAGAGAVASVLLGDLTDAALVAAAARSVLLGAHGAEAEAAADAVAFDILAPAGLPSGALAGIAARLAAAGAPELPRWLAAHPWSAEREARALAADRVGEGPFRPALGDRDWLALGNICERTTPLRR